MHCVIKETFEMRQIPVKQFEALRKIIEKNDYINARKAAREIDPEDPYLHHLIVSTLKRHGWERTQKRMNGKQVYVYQKPPRFLMSTFQPHTGQSSHVPKAEPISKPLMSKIGLDLTSFVGFCDSLNIILGDGQLAIAKCAYDGGDAPGGPIFGNYQGPISELARQIVVAVCGARGGKTRTLIALRILYGALVRDLSGLGKGEEACGLIVAPRLSLAKQAYRYILGEIKAHPALTDMLMRETKEGLAIRRPDGYIVSIEVVAASSKGTTLRGRSLTDAAFDESAFFRGEDYQVSDVELFKAISPRVMAGGQMIIASTPWSKDGLLWDYFTDNYGKPRTAIAVHAPSLALRHDKKLSMLIDLERERDPDNAKREYDAEFLDVAAGLYFDPQCVDAVVSDYKLEEEYNPRCVYAAGADFGFSHDSSALVVVCFDGEHYKTVQIIELKPEGTALRPSHVVDIFAHIIKKYNLHHVVSDIHYREAIRELLSKHNIDLISAPEGRSGKIESYARAKSMMYDQKAKVPNHKRFVQQLKEIKQRPVSGGGLSIESPRKQSGHGDIVSAWVLAMWRLTWMAIHDVQYRDWFRFGAKYKAPDYEKEMAMLEKYDMERYGGKRKEDW